MLEEQEVQAEVNDIKQGQPPQQSMIEAVGREERPEQRQLEADMIGARLNGRDVRNAISSQAILVRGI